MLQEKIDVQTFHSTVSRQLAVPQNRIEALGIMHLVLLPRDCGKICQDLSLIGNLLVSL